MKAKKILIGILAVIFVLGAFLYGALNTTRIVIAERTFHAPVETVWRIWNDPESMKNWWSPKGYTAPLIQNDLVVGGSFLLAMTSPAGSTTYNTGKYLEIIPMEKIVSVMSFADENGNMVPASAYGIPGKWPEQVTVNVHFRNEGAKTHVTVREEGIPTIMSLFAKMGWNQQFDKFEKLIPPPQTGSSL